MLLHMSLVQAGRGAAGGWAGPAASWQWSPVYPGTQRHRFTPRHLIIELQKIIGFHNHGERPY